MSLSERVRGLSKFVAIISDDAALLEGGRKSRSPAMRKNLSILAKECGEIRKQCLEVQKNLPTKTRAPGGSQHDAAVEVAPPVLQHDEPEAIPIANATIVKLKRARTTAPKKVQKSQI